MAGETENLVLEPLRGMRADTASFRSEMERRFDVVETRLTNFEECVEAIETQLEGIRYVIVASVGSLVADMKDHDARIAKLEGTHA